eukprot:4744199-Prymnesium_polylepis.2
MRAPAAFHGAQMCEERATGASPAGRSSRQQSGCCGAGATAGLALDAVPVPKLTSAIQTSPNSVSWPVSPSPAPPKTSIRAVLPRRPRSPGALPSQA